MAPTSYAAHPPPAAAPSELTLVDAAGALHGAGKCAAAAAAAALDEGRALPSPPKSPMLNSDRADEGVDGNEVPVPADMAHLLALLKEELGAEGLDSRDVDVPRIVKLMEQYKSNAADWAKYALFDPYRYTRNLVDDGNGKFNLIVLCWGPGQVSPIHDHANSHCCMKMLDGSLTETRYAFPSESGLPDGFVPGESEVSGEDVGKLKHLGEGSLQRDEVVYINDTLGLHRVSNLTAQPAISLHLYSPPINVCKTYCAATGKARASGQCVFYSVNGERIVAGGCPLAAAGLFRDADSGSGESVCLAADTELEEEVCRGGKCPMV